MIIFISILSIVVLFLTFFRFASGVSLYLLYYFLVPIYSLVIESFSIGQNLFSIILLLSLFVWSGNKRDANKVSAKLMMPFFIVFFAQMLLIPFHFSEMTFADQLTYLRVDLTSLFLPFVMISIVWSKATSQRMFVNVLYIVIAVSSLYSFFLLTRIGQNPYLDSISPWLYSYNVSWQEAAIEEGIRRFGYISSVYTYVTEYGVLLIYSSVFLLYQIVRDKTIMPKILYGMVLVCVIVCGSRSVLMAEVIVLLVFLLQQRQFKLFFSFAIIFIVVWLLIQRYMPEFFALLESIGDESVNGSSINMRIEQLEGCLDSIKDNPIVGNGYGWAAWYRSTIGRHPVMLSFESVLIQILCNNGIMGVVFWVGFVVICLRNVKKFFPGRNYMLKSVELLLVSYFSYTFFTGDYGAFHVMTVFFALFVANELLHSKDITPPIDDKNDNEIDGSRTK